jgi:gluconolactonase
MPYVTHNPRLARLVLGHADLKTLTSGCRWAEGRAYFPAGRYFDLVRHSEQPDDAL